MKIPDAAIKIFKLPAAFLGADFRQFEVMIRTKLMLDGRAGYSTFGNTSGKRSTFKYQLFVLSFLGLLFGLMAFSLDNPDFGMLFFFSALMFMLGMLLITEYTTVLFDKRDNHIFLPRPIDKKTLLFFRLVHVQVYTGTIVLCFSLVSIIVVAVKYGFPALLVFLISLILITWLTLEITLITYLLISKFVRTERFKDIINYIQIGFVVLITVGYQIISKLQVARIIGNTDFSSSWSYFLPPFWFSGLVKLTTAHEVSDHDLVLIALAVLIPFAGGFLLVRFLSKGFERVLAAADIESAGPASISGIRPSMLRRILCPSPAERAGWDLTMATTKRDRKFKGNVYPSVIAMMIFSVLLLKPGFLTNEGRTSDFSYIVGTLIAGFGGFIAIMQLRFTDTPQASWVYIALPVAEHGKIVAGSLKAVFVRFYLPIYFTVLAAIIFSQGTSMILYVLAGFTGSYFISLLIVYLRGTELPFIENYEMQDKGAVAVSGIFMLVLAVIFGGLLYLTTRLPWYVPFLMIIVFVYLTHLIFLKIGSDGSIHL